MVKTTRMQLGLALSAMLLATAAWPRDGESDGGCGQPAGRQADGGSGKAPDAAATSPCPRQAPKKTPRASRYSPPVSVDRLGGAPAAPAPAGPSYGPVLSGGQPPAAVGASPAVPAAPPGPAAVNSCDAGGCWGAAGNRYQGGTGDVYLDGGGRRCLRLGTTMQCN